MWGGGPDLPDMLAGDVTLGVDADAWYDGQLVEEGLGVVDAKWSQKLADQNVRTTMQLVIDDDEGRLQPSEWADPLSPFGQHLQVGMTITAGWVTEPVPLGRFRINDPESESSWRMVTKPRAGKVWFPTGGTVTVPLVDEIQAVVDSELIGVHGPPKTGTIRSEMIRIAAFLATVDVDDVPGINAALPASQSLYTQSRVEVLSDLAARAGGHLATYRTGGVTVRHRGTTPVLDVTRAAGRWIDARPNPTREGIINTVIATGETPEGHDAPVTGAAYERTGPTRYGGPIGILKEEINSQFWTTKAQAQQAANTRLATVIAQRRRRFTVWARFDPRVEVLDRHLVDAPIQRELRTIEATVVEVEHNPLKGGAMRLVYEADA